MASYLAQLFEPAAKREIVITVHAYYLAQLFEPAAKREIVITVHAYKINPSFDASTTTVCYTKSWEPAYLKEAINFQPSSPGNTTKSMSEDDSLFKSNSRNIESSF